MPGVFAAGDIRHGSVKRVAVRLVRNLSPSARFINTSPRCRVKAAAPCNSRSIRGLQRSRPQVDWVRGERYVQDGTITTTAGVTSGVFGALRLVRQLAGTAEAQRVGGELAYPGWSLDGPAAIPAQRPAPRDLTNLLAALAPWRRPTVGVGLAEGIGELDVAAPFEVYATSFAARTVPIAAGRTVTTRHGLRLIAAPPRHRTPGGPADRARRP